MRSSPAIKRFVVFHSADYYPTGGWGDFHGSYDTLEEAKQKAPKPERNMSWTQIVDLQTGEYGET